MAGKDATAKIERLEAFEEKAGVRLEALSAFLYDQGDGRHFIGVNGELHPRRGTELSNDVMVTLTVYDSAARMTATSQRRFFKNDFFGFGAIDLGAWLPNGDVSKIRLLTHLYT